jgi:hypothetical protein
MGGNSKRKQRRHNENLEIIKLRLQNEESKRRHEAEMENLRVEMENLRVEMENIRFRMVQEQHRHEEEMEKIRSGWYKKSESNIEKRKKSDQSATSGGIGPAELFRMFWGRRKLVRNNSLPNYTDIAEDHPPAYR